MDEHLRPGGWILTDGPPDRCVVIPRSLYTVRVRGPNLDVELSIVCAEDIELVEKLLAKMRASVSVLEKP